MTSIADQGLHILNGDSAAGCFRQAFGTVDRLLVHPDILSCGPIPRFQDAAQWRAVRLAYLRQLQPDGWYEHPAAQAFDLLNNLDRLRGDAPIHIWAGIGTEDQLLIAFVIDLMHHVGADVDKVQVVQFESLSNGRRATGLGLLNPQQFRMHPEPRALTLAECNSYRAAWAALCSETPELLAALPGQPSHLGNAVHHIFRRYPDKSSGLNYWDRRLLENVARRGPVAARIIGHTIADDTDDADMVGDRYLFWRLHRMAEGQCRAPLVHVSGTTTQLRGTEVTLFPLGAAVLAGQSSWYPANPIHDWIGGVELSSAKGLVWFYEEGRLVRQA